MNKIIGFLVVFQLVIAVIAFGTESESNCTDGVQAPRSTTADANATVPVQPTPAPVVNH